MPVVNIYFVHYIVCLDNYFEQGGILQQVILELSLQVLKLEFRPKYLQIICVHYGHSAPITVYLGGHLFPN